MDVFKLEDFSPRGGGVGAEGIGSLLVHMEQPDINLVTEHRFEHIGTLK